MKTKISVFITAIVLLLIGTTTIIAQGTKAYFKKDGMTVFESEISNIDSIIFRKTEWVEINGVKWATCNVDAPGTFTARSEDAGMFYQWNRKTGWPTADSVTGWNSSYPTGDTWDKANDPSPIGYRVPTYEEIECLLNTTYVSNVWITQNGISGRKFTDKTTGNSIFLPFTMRYIDCYYFYNPPIPESGSYWTCTQYDSDYACILCINTNYAYWSAWGDRICDGLRIRPVVEEALSVSSISTSPVINITSSTATLGGSIINVGFPAYTERGVCYSTSQNPIINNSKLVASSSGTIGSFTVNANGLSSNTTYYVRAYAINAAGIAYGNQVNFTTSTSQTTEEWVEINGVKWATCNVGSPGTFAANPEDAGMFYQWNRRKGWPATGEVSGWDSSTPAGTTWEKVNDPSPSGYRTPTSEELDRLLNTTYVTNEWTTRNGVNGRTFTDRTTGKSIFMPAAGCRSNDDGDGSLYGAGSRGYYCSMFRFAMGIPVLYFDESNFIGFGGGSGPNDANAYCVRSVLEEEKEWVLINGVKWATRNVDAPGTFAERPEDTGMFYQWNRKKAWPASGNVSGWDISSSGLASAWEKANDPSPAGWRVPTFAEFQKLLDVSNVSNEWISINGVNGRKFTDRATGNSIFLPAAGFRDIDGTLNRIGVSGFYWSSTWESIYHMHSAYYLSFNNGEATWGIGFFGEGHNRRGRPIRAVAE